MLEIKKNNSEIGKHLLELINAKGFNQRQFCGAYLEKAGLEVSEDTKNKMANKLNQIIKGKKAIQIYDLPIFTELLDVTCEEILSAGKCFVPKINRVTNYQVAFSKDRKFWQQYVDREDKLILNQDEYGKTVIDYAIEFKNYAFLKFLIVNNYIWFDSRKDNDYAMTFGAGTSIKRREPYKIDDMLQYRLATEDKLRTDIVSLAIEQGDLETLTELRARESPALYFRVHYLFSTPPDFNAYYDEKLVRNAAAASNEILNYFTEEIEIRDQLKYKDGNERKHIFMFPYISELLGFAVNGKHGFAEIAIKKAIKHNNNTYEALERLINESIETFLESVNYCSAEYIERSKPGYIKRVLSGFDFCENGSIVSFYDQTKGNVIITNIVHIAAEPTDIELKSLVDELNDSYYKIINIANEFLITEE